MVSMGGTTEAVATYVGAERKEMRPTVSAEKKQVRPIMYRYLKSTRR
jgi:hypothetical protein